MCARRPTSAMPKLSFAVSTSRLQPFCLVVAFWFWLVVFPWCVAGGDVMCGDGVCDVVSFVARWDEGMCLVVSCEVMWSGVMWLVAWCHVILCGPMWCCDDVVSCHGMSLGVIWCDCLCPVMSCGVTRCHVMWRHLDVKWCDALGWEWMGYCVLVMRCGWLCGRVTICDSKCLRDLVNWKMMCFKVKVRSRSIVNVTVLRLRTSKFYPAWQVLQSTTSLYYKVLQSTTSPYCQVLQSIITTPYYKAYPY